MKSRIPAMLLCGLFLCSCLGYETGLEDPGGDPQPDSFSRALSGHWMREHIGNCIWMEEWLSFDPPSGFVATMVDRDACYPETHGVFPTPGSLKIEDGPIVTWDYTTRDGRREMRRFSAAIVGSALNWMAFLRSNDTGYHAVNRRLLADPSGIFDSDIHIDLSFDAPLQTTGVPLACDRKSPENTKS